ncbi:hypothetical protein P8891_06220 [Bacillus atrophaeus]|uniref:hypothetical protein n=1 Tax=Bacillus atrophaeus TaxID=1452 RepID=UPI00227FB100|nr:hypothetical protein [Bacillus atrophaeus]MCY7948025.1 hypothetical protein [Bacillus atrophaeus]MCY8098030.1 hypothetical protein [Bacillus atrophaeus]MCY9169954.1 hypothetical protein [Bacillus atrophaeus]MEC0740679.1 hypothetical protein [Bacillus atrophaeus]MEC0747057.1 hypothetical protein [Bacillus atrophaeus]
MDRFDVSSKLNYKEIKELVEKGEKPFIVRHLSKREVVEKDFLQIDEALSVLSKIGKQLRGCLAITCGGYDDVTDELFEIMEVREYVREVFEKHPHIFYYISTDMGSHKWLVQCLFDVETFFVGEKLTDRQIFEKYGTDHESIPKISSALHDNEGLLPRLLKGIIQHGKRNKDAMGSKRVALTYASIFGDPAKSLKEAGLKDEDIKDLGLDID